MQILEFDCGCVGLADSNWGQTPAPWKEGELIILQQCTKDAAEITFYVASEKVLFDYHEKTVQVVSGMTEATARLYAAKVQMAIVDGLKLREIKSLLR